MLSSSISQRDFFIEVSRGRIPGVTYFHGSSIVGSINNIETVVRVEDTADSAFVLPDDAGENMEVVSNSINDSTSGSGCRTISIGYLDTDFLEQTVVVGLNGATPVPVTPINPLKPIARVNRMAGMTFGPGVNISAGNIDVRKVGTTTENIYRRIGAGDSRAKSSVFTVPANKNFFLQSWHFASSAAVAGHYASFKLWSNGESSIFPVIGAFNRSLILGLTQDAHVADDFPIPIRFLPKSDIYSTVVSDAATANITAIVEYYGWFEEII